MEDQYSDFPNAYAYQENQLEFLHTILRNSPTTPATIPFHDFTATPSPPSVISTDQMREIAFRIAVMQPISIDPEEVKPPRRRNVRISSEPQSVTARLRRERISERIRILQRMVPGGTKMDTASMLEEAVQYLKFLKRQVQALERATASTGRSASSCSSGGIDGC